MKLILYLITVYLTVFSALKTHYVILAIVLLTTFSLVLKWITTIKSRRN